jgi:hypothetical protein
MPAACDAGALVDGSAFFQRDELAFEEGVKIGGIQFNVILGVLDQHQGSELMGA